MSCMTAVNPCRNCNKPQRAKGLCGTCYIRERRRKQGVRPAIKLENYTHLNVKVPTPTVERLRVCAQQQNVSLAAYVRGILVAATRP